MSAPKRIWATPMDQDVWSGTFTAKGKLNDDAVEYIRAGIVEDMIDNAIADGRKGGVPVTMNEI